MAVLGRRVRHCRIRLVGEIAAGRPFEVWSHAEWRKLALPAGLRDARKLFAVRVRGDSLIEAGIMNGNIALCRFAQPERNGELCAVLTPKGMTLKYVYWMRDGRVELRSANRDYEPQCYLADEVRIQGVVVMIERGEDGAS